MTGKEETTVRNKNLRLILSGLMLSIMVIGLISLPARADGSFFVYTNPQTGYSIYIDDGEDLLTDSEEAALIEDMKHKIFSNYEYVPQRLSELSEIEIDDKAIDFEYILKKYKIEELLGKKRTKDLIPQIEMEIYGKKTAYDVVISLLTLGERLVGELSQLQKELIQERLYDILEYDFSSSRLVLT